MKKKLCAYILPLLLLSSCQSTVFKNYEYCTILSDSVICTDERIDTPPKDCQRYDNEKFTYKCDIDYLFGYSASNISDYSEVRNIAFELEKDNKNLVRELRQCKGK